MKATARWKELCMDTVGGDELGRFWSAALGLRLHPPTDGVTDGVTDGITDGTSDGVSDIVGDVEAKGIAMCEVPEPKTAKHRVHIDVHASSVAELEALGASVVLSAEESGLGWTVMADPEGGEFCTFLRKPDELSAYRFYELVVDAKDAEAQARWWADVLGGEAKTEQSGGTWWWVEGIAGLPFEGIVFVPVPEPKTVKNRIHWDVYAEVGEVENAGASLLRARDAEIGWSVMADPEGNEFCVFDPVM